ncbi:Bax inhibitor-1/YccA family protein [Streptomyces sp. NBC_01571]|uniref:Bax inhibitor-1/YccA family protein n=1 Tax=Streptomyces sp. NBC_01571 TaxID=2975883 RepID=UPI00225B9D6B|nr:Bax inhibitor-1/YccA family protein [Streptomyces sp. NBC_01571]MCX4573002.1 Bax inhibitor-1/YccA family protein [Streptomyces sp. NBC_01571]
MKSSNPVFSRRGFARDDGRTERGTRQPHTLGTPVGAPVRASAGVPAGAESYGLHTVNPYADDGSRSPRLSKDAPPQGRSHAGTADGAMTIDDVVARSALTLGTVALTAVLSWVLLPLHDAGIGRSYGIAAGAGLLAFTLSLAQSFRREPSPALILAYAAFEGVFLGVISHATSTYIAPGAVVQAVLGTLTVFAGVLIAYRLRWIRVTRRFHGFVLASALGFLLLMVVDLSASAFDGGDGLGFDSGVLGILFGAVGIVLGACFLALDFGQIEDGVAYGAPRKESWLAAFGLTVTLVWIYLEALRVMSILTQQSED